MLINNVVKVSGILPSKVEPTRVLQTLTGSDEAVYFALIAMLQPKPLTPKSPLGIPPTNEKLLIFVFSWGVDMRLVSFPEELFSFTELSVFFSMAWLFLIDYSDSCCRAELLKIEAPILLELAERKGDFPIL